MRQGLRIDSSKGMGQKYNTCLMALGELSLRWQSHALLGNLTKDSWRFADMGAVVVDKQSRTSHDVDVIILADAEPVDFVQMPWGLTHVRSGWVVCGRVPRDQNVCLFNVIEFYRVVSELYGWREGDGRSSPGLLRADELAGLCEAYKLGRIDADELGRMLAVGSPLDPSAGVPDGSLLAMLVSDTDEGSFVEQWVTPDDDNTRCLAAKFFVQACLLGTFSPLNWTELTVDNFPTPPAAEQAKFAQLGAHEKLVVDSLLEQVQWSNRVGGDLFFLREIYRRADRGLVTVVDTLTDTARTISAGVQGTSQPIEVLEALDLLNFVEGRGEYALGTYDTLASLVESGTPDWGTLREFSQAVQAEADSTVAKMRQLSQAQVGRVTATMNLPAQLLALNYPEFYRKAGLQFAQAARELS